MSDPVYLVVVGVAIFLLLWRHVGPSASELAERCVALVGAGDPDPFAPAMTPPTPELRAEVLWLAHRRLVYEELPGPAHEALRRAAELHPERFAERLLDETEDEDERAWGLELAEGALRKNPRAVFARRALAMEQIRRGDPEEALRTVDAGGAAAGPELIVTRARALAELGREREALQLLDGLVETLLQARGSLLSGGLSGSGAEGLDEAASLAAQIREELLGPEAAVLAAARNRRLDPLAAANHRLLAQALMARSPRVARSLELRAPEEDEEQGERILEANAESVMGLCLVGISALRRGRLSLARERFEAARARDPDWFPAALGYAATLTLGESRALDALGELPDPALGPEWEAVLPDLHVLTPEELRVVSASAQPLRALLPALSARGAVARVLPLDVRPTDLEGLAPYDGAMLDDRRSLRGVGGVATTHLALSRIEDLLDTCSEHGWVFAHELAHLARHALPEPLQRRLDGLYAEALLAPTALGQYQLKDIDEFFAVAYVGWLATRHGRSNAPLLDRQGVVRQIHAFFDELDAADAIP